MEENFMLKSCWLVWVVGGRMVVCRHRAEILSPLRVLLEVLFFHTSGSQGKWKLELRMEKRELLLLFPNITIWLKFRKQRYVLLYKRPSKGVQYFEIDKQLSWVSSLCVKLVQHWKANTVPSLNLGHVSHASGPPF